MNNKLVRRFSIAAMVGATLALSACATPFKADVSRFQTHLPAPQGQSFSIAAADPALDGGIEFNHYASMVAAELTRYGYRQVADGSQPELLVRLDYSIDNGRERIRSSPAMMDPWYGGYYGPRYYPMVVRGPNGRRYVYGYRDPFMWGGFGPGWGGRDIESYTVYTSDLTLQISRASDGYRLFEGRAEAQATDNNLTQIVPNLVEAMFTNFPGNGGEKVRITVAPPEKR